MTSDRRFEQDIPDLLAQLAPRAIPDYRDDVVRQTATLRQRPAWTFPERWLPVDITLAPGRGRPRSLTAVLALVLIGLLMAGMLVAYVGSRPTPVPEPFGPAANGPLYFSNAAGEILTMDSLTGTPRTLVKGSEPYVYPNPSRDGRRIMFDHTANDTSTLFVADADGTDVHPLAGSYTGVTQVDWSPDGEQLAIASRIGGYPQISILAADGSATRHLDFGGEVQDFWYMPDGRIAFIGAAKLLDECCGLFVIDPATGEPEEILSVAEFSGLSMHPSPDGRSVLYVKWVPGVEEGGLHIVDLASKEDRVVRIDGANVRVGGASPQNMAINQAHFSPDGTQILFDWFGVTEDHWATVPTAGGAPVAIGPAWAPAPEGAQREAHWSPDGRSVLASYPQPDGTTELWLLDATGGGADQKLSLSASYPPAWGRGAP